MSLADHRARIDRIDDAVLDLLTERAEVVRTIWAAKAQQGSPPHDPDREAALFARLRARAVERRLDPDTIEGIFRRIVGADLNRRE